MENQNIKYKDVPLIKEIEKCNDNILYYGEGGIGKTTQMQLAFNYFSSKCTNTVPIFLDADEEIDFRKADPLMSAIAGKYLGFDIETDDIWKLFTNNSPSSAKNYTYIIFVDGINELTQNNKGYLIEKITHIISESKNTRFIISSRIKENLGLRFKNIAIKPLEKKNILKYLGENYGANDNSKNINDSLVEILQIPLYLSVFKNTYNSSDYKPNIYDESTVRKADILDSYIQKLLHEKRKTNAADTVLFEFIVKYFLPALAFEMVKENMFSIDYDSADRFCESTKYFKGIAKRRFVDFNINSADTICVSNCALLEAHNDVYTFPHQIWRDYFCAKHIINCLNVAYSEQIQNDLETPVDNGIRGFVGQLIYTYDEKFHYSKEEHFPSKKSDRMCECDFEAKDNLEDWDESPIEHYMQQHNLEQEEQNQISPLVTRNLIEIMKNSRNNRVVGKYSSLNLTTSDLKNTNVEYSDFSNARICYNTIFETDIFKKYNYFQPIDIGKDGYILIKAGNSQTFNNEYDYLLYNYINDVATIIDKTKNTNYRFSLDCNYLYGTHLCLLKIYNIKTKEEYCYNFTNNIKKIHSINMPNTIIIEFDNSKICRFEMIDGLWKKKCEISSSQKNYHYTVSNSGKYICGVYFNHIILYEYDCNKKCYLRKLKRRFYIKYGYANSAIVTTNASIDLQRDIEFEFLYDHRLCFNVIGFSNNEKIIFFSNNSSYSTFTINVNSLDFIVNRKKMNEGVHIIPSNISTNSSFVLQYNENTKNLEILNYETDTVEYYFSLSKISNSNNIFSIEYCIKKQCVIIGGNKIKFAIISSYQEKIITGKQNYIEDSNGKVLIVANMNGTIYQIDKKTKKIITKPIITNFHGENSICAIKYISDKKIIILTKESNVYLLENHRVSLKHKISNRHIGYYIPISNKKINLIAMLKNTPRYSKILKNDLTSDVNTPIERFEYQPIYQFSPNGKLFCYENKIGSLKIYNINKKCEFKIFHTIELNSNENFDFVILKNDCIFIAINEKIYKKRFGHYSSLNSLEPIEKNNKIKNSTMQSKMYINYETLLSNTLIYGSDFRNSLIDNMDEPFIEKIKFNGGLI